MKPILFTLLVLFSGLMLNAQNAQQIPLKLVPPVSHIFQAPRNYHHNYNAASRTNSAQVLLNYLDTDANAAIAAQEGYGLFIFPLNSRYTKAMGLANDNDTTGDAEGTNDTRRNPYMTNGIVGFDTLVDFYSKTTFTRKAVDTIYVDTVAFGLSHKNLSGTNDTLILKLVALTAGGYPVLSTVYASDTIVTDTSLNATVSKSLDTLDTYLWTPGTKIAAEQFGIVEYYYGPFMDTLYLWSGAPTFPSSGCAFADGTTLAYQSLYFPNSYSYWADEGAEFPEANGTTLYYPCLSTDKTYTPGLDGASYIEDIDFVASVRLDTNGLLGAGIKTLSNTIALTSLYPNPAGQSANLKLQLKNNSNLNIELVDLSGRVVKTIYEGNQSSGEQQYQINLSDVAQGAYFVNVIGSHGSSDHAKLIVIR